MQQMFIYLDRKQEEDEEKYFKYVEERANIVCVYMKASQWAIQFNQQSAMSVCVCM